MSGYFLTAKDRLLTCQDDADEVMYTWSFCFQELQNEGRLLNGRQPERSYTRGLDCMEA